MTAISTSYQLPGQRCPGPRIMAIFGATGSLSQEKLFPALIQLHRRRLLGELTNLRIIAIGRRAMTSVTYRAMIRDSIAGRDTEAQHAWDELAEQTIYLNGDFGDSATYASLAATITELDPEDVAGHIYYLATAPSAYESICRLLATNQLHADASIVIEKPFGYDLASSQRLDRCVQQYFPEEHIFRCDHYLGKEAVQNLLGFHAANSFYEPLLHRNFVDHVQITVAESVGCERRGGFYDQTGALRDMGQNHLLQLLAAFAMEPPHTMEEQAVRDEKVRVLNAVRRMSLDDVHRHTVRAQYEGGMINGIEVVGYRDEADVTPASITETFVATRLFIDNPRWFGTPFYLRTGKRMARRVAEVAVILKPTSVSQVTQNVLAFRIQPDEGIVLEIAVKSPGAGMNYTPAAMEYKYSHDDSSRILDAYERLLLDALASNQTLFARWDEVKLAWEIVSPILEGWANVPVTSIPTYPAGSWGPVEADHLIAHDGRSWRRP